MQELILTVGLPGSGKSTYINNNYKVEYVNELNLNYQNSQNSPLFYKDNTAIMSDYFNSYHLVSADFIKKLLPGYDSNHPELCHEKSVNLAEEVVYLLLKDNKNVFMDGGGINNNYTARIIENARKINPDIKIKALYFNTPIDVCIKRIQDRERKVPIENIYEKNQKLPRCVNRLKNLCNQFSTINYFNNKYLFLDMDGTICSYSDVCKDIDGNIDFVNGELFKYLTPVEYILNFVTTYYDMNNVYILTACPNSIALEEKKEWLQENFPQLKLKNFYFVGNKDYKHVFLKHLMLKLKMKPNDVCMIDDNYSILDKMRSIGVNAIHPSNINSIL